MGAVGVEATSSQKGDTVPSFYDQDSSNEGLKKAIVELDSLSWMKALHLVKMNRINNYHTIVLNSFVLVSSISWIHFAFCGVLNHSLVV